MSTVRFFTLLYSFLNIKTKIIFDKLLTNSINNSIIYFASLLVFFILIILFSYGGQNRFILILTPCTHSTCIHGDIFLPKTGQRAPAPVP